MTRRITLEDFDDPDTDRMWLAARLLLEIRDLLLQHRPEVCIWPCGHGDCRTRRAEGECAHESCTAGERCTHVSEAQVAEANAIRERLARGEKP